MWSKTTDFWNIDRTVKSTWAIRNIYRYIYECLVSLYRCFSFWKQIIFIFFTAKVTCAFLIQPWETMKKLMGKKHNTLFDILRNKENIIWNYKHFIEIVNKILGISQFFLFSSIVFVIVNILFEIMNRIYTFFPPTVWSKLQFPIKNRLICRLRKRGNQAFDLDIHNARVSSTVNYLSKKEVSWCIFLGLDKPTFSFSSRYICLKIPLSRFF